MAAITLVRLLSAVNPLVSVQVVPLNKTHVARITGKWLFPCMCEDMSFEMIAAPKRSVAVVTYEVFLDFQGQVVIHIKGWHHMLYFLLYFIR